MSVLRVQRSGLVWNLSPLEWFFRHRKTALSLEQESRESAEQLGDPAVVSTEPVPCIRPAPFQSIWLVVVAAVAVSWTRTTLGDFFPTIFIINRVTKTLKTGRPVHSDC